MQLPLHSLRTSIMAHLAFLILSAMLLINVVMIRVAERHLIQNKLQAGHLLLAGLEQLVRSRIECRNRPLEEIASDPHFKEQLSRMLSVGEFSDALVLDRDGSRLFVTDSWGLEFKGAKAISRECLTTKKLAYNFSGTTWGAVWIAQERVDISGPVLIDGRLSAVITIGSSLSAQYKTLRDSEGLILLYILAYTITLVLFGFWLISRTVVRPIHKLLRVTEEFSDIESLEPIADSPKNEIGQLYSSLDLMLKRLDQNKKELKEYISSLEEANQEIKKAQDEIIRSEKLASVGRLATGVAHEIGNPIGIVLGYLELLRGENLGSEERQDFLDRMESEITRINQIIRDLLDFSRTSAGAVKRISIHQLVMETLEMLRPQPMMAHFTMNHMLDATRDIVQADPNQLKQVFLNIFINAADSMAEGSKTPDLSSANILTISSQDRGEFIELRFADTGSGIKKEDLVRIFDPFYTTKETGKGTGLGLSVCYSIVKGLGGEIRAESSMDGGTTIIVILPICREQ